MAPKCLNYSCASPNLEAEPTAILDWFVRRWRIEVTLAEVRRHLGVETQRLSDGGTLLGSGALGDPELWLEVRGPAPSRGIERGDGADPSVTTMASTMNPAR
jgi:hypothetical protein